MRGMGAAGEAGDTTALALDDWLRRAAGTRRRRQPRDGVQLVAPAPPVFVVSAAIAPGMAISCQRETGVVTGAGAVVCADLILQRDLRAQVVELREVGPRCAALGAGARGEIGSLADRRTSAQVADSHTVSLQTAAAVCADVGADLDGDAERRMSAEVAELQANLAAALGILAGLREKQADSQTALTREVCDLRARVSEKDADVHRFRTSHCREEEMLRGGLEQLGLMLQRSGCEARSWNAHAHQADEAAEVKASQFGRTLRRLNGMLDESGNDSRQQSSRLRADIASLHGALSTLGTVRGAASVGIDEAAEAGSFRPQAAGGA